ncbi:MAG: DHA2 family efflux MFS transporter permease subunit, partial [Acidimicrobiia bacterium]
AATVLGSGIAFLDATVVNVALPTIADDLDADLTGLQWTLDAYLVTLAALLLLGGSLGDLYGRRRVFLVGLSGFTGASALCGLAPSIEALIAARALQGAGAALLVPGSLAIISAAFVAEDRSRAVGAWSGLGGVAGAVGPFLGGWLVDAVSWRLVFFINLPLAALTGWVASRHVPESRSATMGGLDVGGAAAVSIGLAGVAYACIEGASGFAGPELAATLIGIGGLVGFVAVERVSGHPMLPLAVFRSAQFVGANGTTLAVYMGLGGATFLLVLQLQNVLGYSALEAGASLLPVTGIMMALSARAGALAQRIGPRVPMTAGPLLVAAGLALFSRVVAGTSYAGAVLPAAVVFGAGLALTVAPLTATVLAAVDEHHLGVGSGFNNAVARLAGLLAVALLPAVAGLDPEGSPDAFSAGFERAMVIAAAVCAAGAAVAFATVRRTTPTAALTQASVHHPCHDPAVRATT